MALLNIALALLAIAGPPHPAPEPGDCSGQAAHTTNVAPFTPPRGGPQPTRPTVSVRVELSSEGDVVGATIASSSGAAAFDNAALLAARTSSFAPERVNCRAVGGSYLIVFTVSQPTPVVVPLIAYTGSPLGDARYGIAAASILNFIDNGAALENPDVRRFIDTFFARIGVPLSDAYAKQQLAVMHEATTPTRSFDSVHARSQFERALSVVMASDSARTERVRFGHVVQAIVLNAAGRRSAFEDYSLRHELRDLSAMDAIKPEIGPLRGRLATEKAGAWGSIAEKGAEMLALLLVD